jgi:hypothetical protein
MQDFKDLFSQRTIQNLQHDEIIGILMDVLPHVGQMLISNSMWHPYGFLQVKLWDKKPVTMRLHIWPPGERPRQIPDWPIHSHPYNLYSRILCGSVTNIMYSIEKSSDSSNLLYRTGSKDNYLNSEVSGYNYSIIEITDVPVDCRILSQTNYEAGQNYCIPRNQYHTTYVEKNLFTATLVFATDYIDYPAYVVGEKGKHDFYVFERRNCNKKLFIQLVEELMKRASKIHNEKANL